MRTEFVRQLSIITKNGTWIYWMLQNPLLIGTLILACVWYMAGDSTEAVSSAGGGYEYPGYELLSVESFAIEARVLSRENYTLGREADLSPTDLALGWGPMADEQVLNDFQFSQRNRWYFWKAQHLPIPRKDITNNSANVHIIPGNALAAHALEKVRPNDRIRLVGRLVDVDANDGWRWRTSRSRSDTGKGSCEILWLERLDWI